MLRAAAFSLTLAITAAATAPALGQAPPPEHQACFDPRTDQPADLDKRIAGCLSLIGANISNAEISAAAHLRRALAYLQRARLSGSKDDVDRALADLSETIRLAPDNAAVQRQVHQMRAGLHLHAGDYERAAADYTVLIGLDPNSASAYEYRGFVHATKGDHDRAVADYAEAIRREPNLARLYNQRAWSYLHAGKPTEGLPDADKALALEPNDAVAYATRGLIRRALGSWGESIEDLRKALSLDPADEGIKEELRLTEASQQLALGADGKGGDSKEKEQLKAEIRKAKEAAKAAQERLAALENTDTRVAMAPVKEQPSATESSLASAADPTKLARDLQTELKRVGCLNGEVDGDWGEQSKKALKTFARHAKLSIDSDEPTAAVLDAAVAMKARACPVVCDDDEKLVDGSCVAKQRRARREPVGEGRRQATREGRRYRDEQPSAEAKGSGGGSGLKLCVIGPRQMGLCP